jgi:hypothetical protein
MGPLLWNSIRLKFFTVDSTRNKATRVRTELHYRSVGCLPAVKFVNFGSLWSDSPLLLWYVVLGSLSERNHTRQQWSGLWKQWGR